MPRRAETTVRVNTTTKSEQFRKLPSVDELLREEPVQRLIENAGRMSTTTAVRETLAELREKISAGAIPADQVEHVVSSLAVEIERRVREAAAYSLQPVVNATGVVLHTNLGRAPLSEEAMKHAAEIATGYSNLEFDLEQGERGKRDTHIKDPFQQLFVRHVDRSLATIVVNNNAAAVLLALSNLAEGV